MLGCKNVNDVLYTICYVLMSYIVLSFMYIIFRCCLIQCYIFYVVVIMFMGGIHYKLFLLLFHPFFQYVYFIMYNMFVFI